LDLDPDSLTKDLEDVSLVEKYKITEENYENLPDNFRKFKQKLVDKNIIT